MREHPLLCFRRMSSTVSRVLYRMIIYLDCTLPHSSFAPCGTKRDIPESTTGRRIAFCFVLLRVGFTQPLTLPQERWSLTPPFHPYQIKNPIQEFLIWRFLFCCTFLRVASTGRYPASCPMEPGLSSPAGKLPSYGATICAAHILLGLWYHKSNFL